MAFLGASTYTGESRVEHDGDYIMVYLDRNHYVGLRTPEAIALRDQLADALTQASIERDAQQVTA